MLNKIDIRYSIFDIFIVYSALQFSPKLCFDFRLFYGEIGVGSDCF